MVEYRYELKSTGKSSYHFGPCEACGNHASEVFIQAESRDYIDDDGKQKWTFYRCRPHAFGHRECLTGLRR